MYIGLWIATAYKICIGLWAGCWVRAGLSTYKIVYCICMLTYSLYLQCWNGPTLARWRLNENSLFCCKTCSTSVSDVWCTTMYC